MGHEHHDHTEGTFKVAIMLTTAFFVVEVVGGFLSGSLSLLGDAGHMFQDMFALFVSLSAILIAKKAPTKTRTFGYHRLKIFAAFLNGLLLVGISVGIFWEAYKRLSAPEPVQSVMMFAVALIGLLVNLYVAFRLHGSHDLNVRSAFLHVVTDALSSVAVILASVWIYFTGQTVADPVVGMGISVLILFSALSVLRESIYVLLEFTPKNINFDEVVRDIESVSGVKGVHNVHLWSLSSHINVIDAHIFTSELSMDRIEKIKKAIKGKLEKYDIKHAVLEFECEECAANYKVREVQY